MATPTITAQIATNLSDSDLLCALTERCASRMVLDADIARLAAEAAERSRPTLGSNGLASRMRASGPAALLVMLGRMTRQDAARYVKVGTATAPGVSITGEPLEPQYPNLAVALATGTVTVDSAAVIVSSLDQASPRAHPEDLQVAELALAEFAQSQPSDLVRRFAISCRDRLDTDGMEPREADLVRARKLTLVELASGMHRLTWDLDPLTAATVTGYLNQYVNNVFHRGTQHDDPFRTAPDEADHPLDIQNGKPDLQHDLVDTRTRGQLASDAVLALFGHVSNCTHSVSPMPNTTLVIRMTLDSLLTGLGEASLDGIEQPISAGTARRMAAEAHIIPIVLGGDSEVLDFGRARRLFTKKQKLAAIETFPCCAGCGRPPDWTELHHLRWYDRDNGPSNLSNAIPLCSSDHHAVHDNGWEITVKNGVPWFIPPSEIDMYRTPRRGHTVPKLDLPSRR